MRVLVGFASAQGSTAAVARRIGAVFESEGHTADVLPIGNIASLSNYDVVMLGSAIHNQAWLPEAMNFAQTHMAELAARPVWLFSVGMSAALPRFIRRAAQTSQEKHLLKVLGRIPMRGHRLFSGVSSPEQMPRWAGLLFRLIGGRFGDFRDWPAIESWAKSVAGEVSQQVASRERLDSLQVELEDAASSSWRSRILHTLVSQYGRTQLRFVARAKDGSVLYESGTFAGPPLGRTPPQDNWAPGMNAALTELKASVRSDGWQETSRGNEPWQLTFAR